jgi:hypothetical protein
LRTKELTLFENKSCSEILKAPRKRNPHFRGVSEAISARTPFELQSAMEIAEKIHP